MLGLLAGGAWKMSLEENRQLPRALNFSQNNNRKTDRSVHSVGPTQQQCGHLLKARQFQKHAQPLCLLSRKPCYGHCNIRHAITSTPCELVGQAPSLNLGTLLLKQRSGMVSHCKALPSASKTTIYSKKYKSLGGLISLAALIERDRNSSPQRKDIIPVSIDLTTLIVSGNISNDNDQRIGTNSMLRLLATEESFASSRRELRKKAQPYYLAQNTNIQQATMIAWADLCARSPTWLNQAASRWQRQLEQQQARDGSWDYPNDSWRGAPLGPIADTAWALMLLNAVHCRISLSTPNNSSTFPLVKAP